MAVSPKAPKSSPRSKPGSTLSATEALKAAEAAIAVEPKKAPAPAKPATAKPVAAKPSAKPAAPSVKPIDTKPQTMGGVKPVDTNPQKSPTPAPTPAPTPTPAPAPTPTPAASKPEITESLTEKAATIASQPLPAEGKLIMNDVIETGKKFAEDTKVKLETAYADFNEKAKGHVEKSTKAIEELSDIAKGNVEAMVESGKIAAKGIETMGQEAVDYSKKNFEKATASFKTFSTVKTPTEFFQLQSQLFSSSFDEFAKEAAKNSEAFIKLAGDIAQPLTARVTLVTDKVKSLAA